MKNRFAVSLIFMIGCTIHSNESKFLTTHQVSQLLDSAYAYQDSGQIHQADSIYKILLHSSVSRQDSLDIANGYIEISLQKNDSKAMRKYLDFACPKSSTSINDRVYRCSNFFHIYMIEKKCDSARIEINNLYDLFNAGEKQLSIEDINLNNYVLLKNCYNLPDSAQRWAANKHLTLSPPAGARILPGDTSVVSGQNVAN